MLTKKLWVCNPSTLMRLQELPLGTKDCEDKVFNLVMVTDLDMATEGWIEVGTVSMEYHLELTDKTTQAAMAAFDMAEAKLREEFNTKFAELMQAKQEFLSLPAPKDSDD